jgi:integrase
MKRRNGLRVYIRNQGDRDHLTLYYHTPGTGKIRTRSAETSDRKEAERAAARWEAELLDHHGHDGAGWLAFRERFEEEHLAFKSPKTAACYGTALTSFEDFAQLGSLNSVSTAKLSSYAAALAKGGYPHATIKSYLTHLRAAFRWAERIGLIRKAPHAIMPQGIARKHMRGRPLTRREVGAMLRACDSVFPKAAGAWKRLIRVLWYLGLRLGESLQVSWDTPPLVIRLDAKPWPLIIIDAEGQKSRTDSAVPLTPECVAWLKRTPEHLRTGYLVDVRNAAGKRFEAAKLSEEVSKIGKAAGVRTDGERFASAHDLRRTFATRWAAKVRPMTLQRMLRHSDLSTTLRFYVGLAVEDIGAELWAGAATTRKDS